VTLRSTFLFVTTALVLLPSACDRSSGSSAAAPAQTHAPVAQVDARAEPTKDKEQDAGAEAALVATVTTAAETDAGDCEVRVTGVSEARVYGGPGVDSPMRAESIRRLPPKTAQKWASRDHAYSHLACTYSVRVNGKTYRYRHNAGQALGRGKLDPATCSTDETRVEVEAQVANFTKQCSNLHAGEYWGYRLDPIAP
jgi:hypothetical protein